MRNDDAGWLRAGMQAGMSVAVVRCWSHGPGCRVCAIDFTPHRFITFVEMNSHEDFPQNFRTPCEIDPKLKTEFKH